MIHVWRLTLPSFPVLDNQSIVCLLLSLALFCTFSLFFFAFIFTSSPFFCPYFYFFFWLLSFFLGLARRNNNKPSDISRLDCIFTPNIYSCKSPLGRDSSEDASRFLRPRLQLRVTGPVSESHTADSGAQDASFSASFKR